MVQLSREGLILNSRVTLQGGPEVPALLPRKGPWRSFLGSSTLGLGYESLDLDAAVPHRRVVELACYGMAAHAPQLRRHPISRRVATLACTLAYLEAKAVDDALELLDLLMANDLLAKAEKGTKSERARQFAKLARASGLLARAWGVFCAATESGEEIGLDGGVGSHRGSRLPGGAGRCRGNRA